MKEKEYETALLISGKFSYSLGDPEFVVHASICKIEDGNKVRNHGTGDLWNDINISERHYLYKMCAGDYELHSYQKIYHDSTHSELKDIEIAYKALKAIHGGLDKIYKEEGPALDFAQFLQRISKVLKIKKWVWSVGRDTGWHNENQHYFAPVPDGMYHVRRLSIDNAEWQRVIKEKDAKLAA